MISRRHFRALQWAVGEAANWRGSLVGNPDPAPLKVFDQEIKLARKAINEIQIAMKEKK